MHSPPLSTTCVPGTFASLSLFGAQVITIDASLVNNLSGISLDVHRISQPTTYLSNATICNVTVSYTHPGQLDNIIVETWLPVDDWNGRLQTVGGGGYMAGGSASWSYPAMYGAVADGYVAITSDAGLGLAQDASEWALLSPGNVNLYNLQNLASVSLDDEANIGKSLIRSFYGKGPDYSYWNGCSQGGRQGLMLAQRYPTAYDGIIAGAPAAYWTTLLPSIHWPQQVMNMYGEYPYECEIDNIVAASIEACDRLDGVLDGIISQPDKCLGIFDPFTMVGRSIKCPQEENNGTVQISKIAAQVVHDTWHGMTTAEGKRLSHGLYPPADLTGNRPSPYGTLSIAETNCTSGVCKGAPSILGAEWLQLFVVKDPEFDLSSLTHVGFDALVQQSRQSYSSMIDTYNPDLTAFRDAGGKMITFHGLADNIIPSRGSRDYYDAVTALDPEASNFYRLFEMPGLGHCYGGSSGQPTHLFDQLRAWVEENEAPDRSPVVIQDLEGISQNRVICAYPKSSHFNHACGDDTNVDCWYCG